MRVTLPSKTVVGMRVTLPSKTVVGVRVHYMYDGVLRYQGLSVTSRIVIIVTTGKENYTQLLYPKGHEEAYDTEQHACGGGGEGRR